MTSIVPINLSDDNIIAGIKGFDEVAGNNLYNKHKDYCLRFMNKMHLDEETNRDIYQDAIIVFIEKIREDKLLLINTTIQTYLNSICRNQVLVRLNQKNKPVLMGNDWDNNYSDQYTDWFDEQTEIKNNRIIIIMEELKAMKEKGQVCYELLKKVFFENKSMGAVAVLMNYTNAENAKNQSYRCRERLKKQVFERLQQC
jgi:DNA-directed RNA polymerase specialized sigma24 family protein